MNSNTDPRKQYIANHIKNIFQLNEVPKTFYSNPILDDFLDEVEVSAIKIYQKDQSNEIVIIKIDSSNPQSTSQNQLDICISKIKNEEISSSNFQQNLSITTLNSNPLVSLLNNLKNVYLPSLQNSNKVDNNIKRLLDELKIGIDNTIYHTNNSGRDNVNFIFPLPFLY